MLSKAESRRLHALKRRKARAETGLFLAEGIRVVEDLLASAVVPQMALIAPSLEDTPRGAELARRLRADARTVEISDRELNDLAGTESPQGVVVVAHIPRYSLPSVQLAAHALVVLLDAVQDPGNFGSIVRSADSFGASLVIALPGTVDPWNAKAVRAAAGSSLRVSIIEATVADAVAFLRTHDVRLYGADVGGRSVEELDVPTRSAIALGNEGAGLTAAVRNACDELVSIPIQGSAESLNVGVAAGILLYLFTREQ